MDLPLAVRLSPAAIAAGIARVVRRVIVCRGGLIIVYALCLLLCRLLIKLGFINERPEHRRDDRWSETGDRYMLKLFRDYVFHQGKSFHRRCCLLPRRLLQYGP